MVMVLVQMGLLSASLADVQLALGDEAGGGGEEQGEGGHGSTAEKVERRKKGKEHQDY